MRLIRIWTYPWGCIPPPITPKLSQDAPPFIIERRGKPVAVLQGDHSQESASFVESATAIRNAIAQRGVTVTAKEIRSAMEEGVPCVLRDPCETTAPSERESLQGMSGDSRSDCQRRSCLPLGVILGAVSCLNAGRIKGKPLARLQGGR